MTDVKQTKKRLGGCFLFTAQMCWEIFNLWPTDWRESNQTDDKTRTNVGFIYFAIKESTVVRYVYNVIQWQVIWKQYKIQTRHLKRLFSSSCSSSCSWIKGAAHAAICWCWEILGTVIRTGLEPLHRTVPTQHTQLEWHTHTHMLNWNLLNLQWNFSLTSLMPSLPWEN